MEQLKKNWWIIAGVAALAFYIWNKQQNTSAPNQPAGGAAL